MSPIPCLAPVDKFSGPSGALSGQGLFTVQTRSVWHQTRWPGRGVIDQDAYLHQLSGQSRM